MMMGLTWDLNAEMNKIYKPLLKDEHRYIIIQGGSGSGKSYFIAQKIFVRIIKAIKEKKRIGVLALRKTGPAVRHSVFALLKNLFYRLELDKIGRIRETDMTFTFPYDSFIKCSGLDDPEKIKSIVGVTDIWMEEATEFTELDFTQLDLRLRGETDYYKQMMLSYNPIDWNSFIRERFSERHDPNATVIQTTYKDNVFLDDEYQTILLELQNQDMTLWTIYGEGNWAILKGLIFNNWDITDSWPENFDEIIYGVDFGFRNPSAVLEIGIKDQELFIKEKIYESGLTNNQFIDAMNAVGLDKNNAMYADSAEPARIEEISHAGYWIMASEKGKNSVKDSIDNVKRHVLHIHPDSVNTIKEIRAYKWKESSKGNEPEEPVAFNDHAMSCLRYAVFSHADANVPSILGWI